MTKQSQDDQGENSNEDIKIVDAENVEAEIIETVEPSWKDRLLSVDHWLRFAFMVLFLLILGVVSYLIVALVVLQFFWALIAGEGNDKLRDFGSSVARFILQVLRFLTYNTDHKPFPFADWPESENVDLDK
jgi:hypothetical protein